MIMNNVLAQSGGSENKTYTLESTYSESSLAVCFIGEDGIELHSGTNGLEKGTYKIRPWLLIARQYTAKNPANISGFVEYIGGLDKADVYRVYGNVLIS